MEIYEKLKPTLEKWARMEYARTTEETASLARRAEIEAGDADEDMDEDVRLDPVDR